MLWSCLAGLALLVVVVNGASIEKRSAPPGKKVVRHGDELFLVDIDEHSDDNHHNHHQHHNHKRSTDNHRQVIRVGDELIVLKDDGGDDDDDDDKSSDRGHTGGHQGGIHKRNAIKDESYRWKDKTVPYLFDSTFDSKDQALVKSAMDEWSRHTCVRFRPATSSDVNKVKFVQGDGCFSFVGMVEKTQSISLDQDGCRYISTALHEIGHALGMYHTQVRPDRDQYIKVDLSDVAKDLKDNFEKQTRQSSHHYGVDYDFTSIMHYDGTSFTSNGGTSIKTLDPKWQKIIGNAKHLSFGDIEMMNKMYHCAPASCSLKDADCPGTSFVDQTCKCVCPGSSSENPVIPCSGAPNGQSNNNAHTSTGGNSHQNNNNKNSGDGGFSQQEHIGQDDDWDNSDDDWVTNNEWEDDDDPDWEGDDSDWEYYR